MLRPLQSPAASPLSGNVRAIRRVGLLPPVRLFFASALCAALAFGWLARDVAPHPASPRPALPAQGPSPEFSALLPPLSASAPSFSGFNSPIPAERDPVTRAEELATVQPERAREFAYEAIAALHHAERPADAAAFALHSSLGPRRDLVIAAYFDWGRRAPDAALPHAFAITDAAAREFALQAVFSGWAKNDPAGLADVAARFPAGHERTAALTKALRYWSLQDPAAAEAWLVAHDQALPAAERALRED